jgi:putative acetyltransferase
VSPFSTSDACLRPEYKSDAEAIRRVNVAAFERTAEANLVDSLREAGAVILSAVVVVGAVRADAGSLTPTERSRLCTAQVRGGEVVGHALLTPVTVATDKGEVLLLGLGPVAVEPAHQRLGLGTMMVSGCLEYMRARGHRGVVVVGDPTFYRRFGFIGAARWGLDIESGVPEEQFMALALKPGVLGGMSGTVRYRSEFANI